MAGREGGARQAFSGGAHGHGNAAPDMAALLRDLIGLPPGKGLDGDALFKEVLNR